MTRFLLQLLPCLLLLIVQVSFINALPFPFDRIPLLLVITVYLFQFAQRTSVWWWFVAYGALLDSLAISQAPLETISYAVTALVMAILALRVFTNKSFYSVFATALICLLVLTLLQELWVGVAYLFSSSYPFWKQVIATNLWAAFFAAILLLLIFPASRHLWARTEQFIFERE